MLCSHARFAGVAGGSGWGEADDLKPSLSILGIWSPVSRSRAAKQQPLLSIHVWQAIAVVVGPFQTLCCASYGDQMRGKLKDDLLEQFPGILR